MWVGGRAHGLFTDWSDGPDAAKCCESGSNLGGRRVRNFVSAHIPKHRRDAGHGGFDRLSFRGDPSSVEVELLWFVVFDAGRGWLSLPEDKCEVMVVVPPPPPLPPSTCVAEGCRQVLVLLIPCSGFQNF